MESGDAVAWDCNDDALVWHGVTNVVQGSSPIPGLQGAHIMFQMNLVGKVSTLFGYIFWYI
jgi:hypothetical protein